MTYSLTWLPGVLRAAGLKVIETDGWATRGHGDVGAIKGIICHHTAGPRQGNYPSLDVVTKGRPDLAGPLCNLSLGRDGTFYAVAAGKAWHAGAGLWQGVHDGNGQMIGIEAENTGLANDQPWPPVQMDAYAKGDAAILTHIGAKPIMCCGHFEYALPIGRKADPSFNLGSRAALTVGMERFRLAVAAAMGAPVEHAIVPLSDGAENTRWLQLALNTLDADPQLIVDGISGEKTIQAIEDFQGDHEMKVTGLADDATLAAIRDALGHHDGCACGGALAHAA